MCISHFTTEAPSVLRCSPFLILLADILLWMDGWNVRRRVLGASGCWLEASPQPLQPPMCDSHRSKPLLCRRSGGMTSLDASITSIQAALRRSDAYSSSQQQAGIFTSLYLYIFTMSCCVDTTCSTVSELM